MEIKDLNGHTKEGKLLWVALKIFGDSSRLHILGEAVDGREKTFAELFSLIEKASKEMFYSEDTVINFK